MTSPRIEPMTATRERSARAGAGVFERTSSRFFKLFTFFLLTWYFFRAYE